MDKKKILNTILNYMSENHNDISEPESQFINEFIKENQAGQKMKPPYEVYYNLVENQSRKKDNLIERDISENNYLGRKLLRLTAGFAGVFIVASVVFWYSREQTNKEIIVEKTFKSFNVGEKIKKVGLEIQSENKGEIALVSSKNTSNYIMKSGNWSVDSDHTKFEKETWFHFPGGGLKPVGTSFNIKIINGKSIVDLSEGKIQTYGTDKNGSILFSKILDAPFKENFSGSLPRDIAKVDLLIKRVNKKFESDKIKKTKMESPRVVTRENSIYGYFFGAEIIVKDKKGDRVSGVLTGINNGDLLIKDNNRIIRVEEKSMTLVGLDTHPNSSLLKE